MNGPLYSDPQPQAGEARPALATYPAPGDLSAQSRELSQLILTGMQQDIDTRIEWRLQQVRQRQGVSGQEIGVILGSIGVGVPLTAIAGAAAGLAGIVVIWLGLVLINVAWAARR